MKDSVEVSMNGREHSGYFFSPLYHDMATYQQHLAAPRKGRVFLFTTPGDRISFEGRNIFDRVQLILIDPGELPVSMHSPSLLGALPDVVAGSQVPPTPRALLPATTRPICGEILKNQDGRLFERRGNQLLPLHNLVAGPHGEVLEFAGSLNTASAVTEARAMPSVATQGFAAAEAEATPDLTRHPAAGRVSPKNQAARGAYTWKTLFEDPGRLQFVNLGDFRPQLLPQLQKPEILRDSHRLPCYVQIFEILEPQPLSTLAAFVGDPELTYQLHFVNEEMAKWLGISNHLRNRSAQFSHTPRQAGWLLQGDLICRLRLVRDPTQELGSFEACKTGAVRDSLDQPHMSPSEEHKVPARAIPDRFLNPWEFRITREEAIYEMDAEDLGAGWLSHALRAVRGWIHRKELRRWQALLAGRNLEDQLWTVRPPKWALKKSRLREWARRTLTLAGYDSDNFLTEWEIYWRRKGF
jgi:hypothetical protein